MTSTHMALSRIPAGPDIAALAEPNETSAAEAERGEFGEAVLIPIAGIRRPAMLFRLSNSLHSTWVIGCPQLCTCVPGNPVTYSSSALRLGCSLPPHQQAFGLCDDLLDLRRSVDRPRPRRGAAQ